MPTLPIARATNIEASNPSERDKTVPTKDQNVPRINRAASGDASSRRLVPRKTGGQIKFTVSLTLKVGGRKEAPTDHFDSAASEKIPAGSNPCQHVIIPAQIIVTYCWLSGADCRAESNSADRHNRLRENSRNLLFGTARSGPARSELPCPSAAT